MLKINIQLFGGRGGGSSVSTGKASSILNPTTKQDYLNRLQFISDYGSAGYKSSVSTSEWENYGKSRTYMKINFYRESDGRLHHSIDYGYYDNKANSYVKSSKSPKTLSGNLYSAGGDKLTEKEVKQFLKTRKRK